jgi:hypothetical protein
VYNEIDEFLDRIETVIRNTKDEEIRRKLILALKDAIELEQKRVKYCARYRNCGQTSGIDFEDAKNRVDALLNKRTGIGEGAISAF